MHVQIGLTSSSVCSLGAKLPSHSGTGSSEEAAAELPAPGKLPSKFLNFSKGSERGKSELGPATQSLRNACTKIQLLKSASYLFHRHFHLRHCKRDLFNISNQQQPVTQRGKLHVS